MCAASSRQKYKTQPEKRNRTLESLPHAPQHQDRGTCHFAALRCTSLPWNVRVEIGGNSRAHVQDQVRVWRDMAMETPKRGSSQYQTLNPGHCNGCVVGFMLTSLRNRSHCQMNRHQPKFQQTSSFNNRAISPGDVESCLLANLHVQDGLIPACRTRC